MTCKLDLFWCYIERVDGCNPSREMLAAYTGPASRIENVQTVDIAEERDCREAFVERIVWLCRNGFCVALGKLVIRFTSDRLRRPIHIGHGLALVSSEELHQFVNDLNADVEWLIMAGCCLSQHRSEHLETRGVTCPRALRPK
jgi:hypothetical protein